MLGALLWRLMVTSPVTPLAVGFWRWGRYHGTIIRLFGGLPEGVMYSILMMNAITSYQLYQTESLRSQKGGNNQNVGKTNGACFNHCRRCIEFAGRCARIP